MKRNLERNMNEQSPDFKKYDDLKFRFKESLELNMKDGDENEELVTNSVILEQLKENPAPEDKEEEIRATSADAGTEYSWGFLLWSFMHFGADNALTGHSGYWLSKSGRSHDFWSAIFDDPKSIDTVEVQWRYPPKRMKIFYRLDATKDWIGATEVFIKQEQKDKHGNIIPTKGSPTYTIYFKKALLCTQFKIMMNDPLIKKSFSINSVKFYHKNNRGIIKAPLINEKIIQCWYINTNIVRSGIPVYVYPCTDGISVPHSNEIFEKLTNHQIKPYKADQCVGYDKKTKDVILSDCTEISEGSKIFYNEDYTMYFKGLKDTPIAIDTKNKNINFIEENTEVTASSEGDTNEFKKENLLNEGNSYWQSDPGKQDVTIQLFFGKIKCADCPQKGKFESRKIDMIRIKWEKNPSKFSVFTWNPGQSWKTVATFDNYTERNTNISLTQETAAAVMIKMSDGNKYGELGNQVAYAISSVGVFFNASKLYLKNTVTVPTIKKIFDFESQAILYKQIGNDLEDNLKELGSNYEKSIATYKNMKASIGSVEIANKKNKDICKKLSKMNDVVKNSEVDKLDKYNREKIKKINHKKFYKYLKKFNDQEALENILGIKTKGENEEDGISKSNPLNFLTSLLTKNKVEGSSPKKASPKASESNNSEEDEELGSFENPAPHCLQIKLVNKAALSGFYFIQPECADNPLRAFCDFALYETAVDIHVYKAGSVKKTPNLSYLHIKTPQDVRDQCGEVGLVPIELKNKEMIARIQNILNATGMDINSPHFVPLGYDYSCSGIKCADIFNSLNKKSTDPIMKFFNGKIKPLKKAKTSFQFVGLGDTDEMKMTRYNEKKMEITGMICSTNITNEKQITKKFKTIDCDFTLNENMDSFKNKKEVNFICPKGCDKSSKGVFGAGTYNGKSSICQAAVHAGAIADHGGKIEVRIDEPQEQYAGTNANGVTSTVMPSDGSKSFILFKYKPDCPKKKAMSSFITEEENTFLENEKILENALGGNLSENALNSNDSDIKMNAFIENMSKENNVQRNKRDFLTNNLIPQLNNMATGNNNNYRFIQNQIQNMKNNNKLKFTGLPSIPGIPSTPSLPSGLNSPAISDAASNIANAAGAGKNAIGDFASSLFGNKDDGDAKPNKPNALGKFEPPTDLMPDSVSSPSLPRTFGPEQAKNLMPAMSSAQTHSDPTKEDSNNKPSSQDPPVSKETPDKSNPDPPQAVEGDLKKKPQKSEATDLKNQGSEATKNAPDPLENVPDKEEKKDDDDEQKINKDIPTNVDKSKAETTDIAKKRLDVVYESGYLNYLKNLKKKMNKVSDAIKDYVKLNTPLFGNKGLDLEYCEADKCFSEGCNITNLPDVRDIIIEKAKKMESLIQKFLDRINARIYKTKDIKSRWIKNYSELTEQDPVKIDYSIYPNSEIASEKIFSEIFEVQKLGNEKVLHPTEWKINSNGIKGRPRVMAIEFLPDDTTGGASNLVLKDKNYFDFRAKFDILLSDSGTISINFRQMDNFNYYSFIIDKKSGNKILSKNINGQMEILSTENDGGISINQWHTVSIWAIGNKISVKMFDVDNKKATKKTMEIFDSSHIRGTMGFNVNGVQGFYFDNYEIKPNGCWTAWLPKENLVINNPNSSIHNEEFMGNMKDFYTIHELDESIIKDGPAFWSMKDAGPFEKDYILQENSAYDSSNRKTSNFITLNDKNFQHGTYIVKFTPLEKNGIISIIFKYSNVDNIENYYSFELNNERDNPTLDLKLINTKEIKSLASKDASQINDFKKKAYIPNRLNFVKIDVINDKITVSVSHDNRELIEVFSISNDMLKGGLVGFGTYKTPSKFSTISLSPPNLDMTPQDVNKVLTTSPARLFSTIPFPSPKKIQDLTISIPKGGASISASAIEGVKHEVTRFASSLGYNFNSDKTAGDDNKKKEDSKPDAAGNGDKFKNDNDLAEWKNCVNTRSQKDRAAWCSNTFPSDAIKSRCENNFCDTCCTRSVAPGKTNISHMCKKGCYRASIASDKNDEYKNVCITSPNNQQNIYSFCQDKFASFNPKLIIACKLDMCNLCCVGMDTIKKKNYSVPNLKACFNDCSKNYNVIVDSKDLDSDNNGKVSKEEKDECSSPPNEDPQSINKEEKVEASYLVKSYMRYSQDKK